MYVFDRYITLQFLLILIQDNEGAYNAGNPATEGEQEYNCE